MSGPTIDLAGPRTIAEGTLLDECAITRASPVADVDVAAMLDRDTGLLTRPPDTDVWTGPCSVNAADTQGIRSDTGEDDRLLNTYVCRVPVAAVGIRAGDLLTVTSVHSGGDPDLAGRTFTVRQPHARTTTILRRLILIAASDAEAVPI